MDRWNHHLLNIVSARPQWLTVKSGAKAYVDTIMKTIPKHRVHLSTPITAVRSGDNGKILVSTERGSLEYEYEYDHVILATHGDQALRLLGKDATKLEKDILGVFKTSKNTAILHSDKKVIYSHPLSRSCWGSNPDYGNQNPVCYPLHYKTFMRNTTQPNTKVIVNANP